MFVVSTVSSVSEAPTVEAATVVSRDNHSVTNPLCQSRSVPGMQSMCCHVNNHHILTYYITTSKHHTVLLAPAYNLCSMNIEGLSL